jgi:hypothetical protein
MINDQLAFLRIAHPITVPRALTKAKKKNSQPKGIRKNGSRKKPCSSTVEPIRLNTPQQAAPQSKKRIISLEELFFIIASKRDSKSTIASYLRQKLSKPPLDWCENHLCWLIGVFSKEN